MANNSITGYLLKKMLTNGAVNLKNNHKEIDHLNVFPIPDGDTGTNMQMTMMAGIKEVNTLNEEDSIVNIAQMLSRGLMFNARGNSGVILSQFFRGFSTEIAKAKDSNISVTNFIDALVGGYKMAYRAIIDPVEGTILTVVRESAERVKLQRDSFKTIDEVMDAYIMQARQTLSKTPELLPVLKEAGVVDSGGAGFIKIIEGMKMALDGNFITENVVDYNPEGFEKAVNHGFLELADIKFGYCTEFITKLFNPDTFKENTIIKPLKTLGDSMVVAVMDDLLKVHIHTNQPGVVITLSQKYGEIQTIKVENMRLQNEHAVEAENQKVKKAKEKTKYAILAVASGNGLKQVFKDLGVDHIIDGGQTMNPSTQDFVEAINLLNAENIIILPNNSNIIMAAEQTIDLLPDINIRVLKTKNISQGYSSLMVFDPTVDIDDNMESMSDMISEVSSGEVTYSIRDTKVNDVEIKKDDYIGILNNKIVVSTNNINKTVKKLLKEMIVADSGFVTVFYGNGVDEKQAQKILDYIYSIAPDVEVEMINGEQDVYSYIISVS